MLAKKAIEQAFPLLGFYAQVFIVPEENGKQRHVFNMKPLNAFIVSRSFQMTTLKMVAEALRTNDFVVSLVLSNAYFHLSMAPQHRLFLRFEFQGKLFRFKAMPFGFSSAPRICTKITHPVTLFCRRLGIRIIF